MPAASRISTTPVVARPAPERAWVPVSDRSSDQPPHDPEHRQQQDSVQCLGQVEDADERRPGDQDEPGCEGDRRGVAEVEHACVGEAIVEAAVVPAGLAHRVRGGGRHDARGEQCGTEQADREPGRREMVGERLERRRGIGGVHDLPALGA